MAEGLKAKFNAHDRVLVNATILDPNSDAAHTDKIHLSDAPGTVKEVLFAGTENEIYKVHIDPSYFAGKHAIKYAVISEFEAHQLTSAPA
jgi:hypothetical protein